MRNHKTPGATYPLPDLIATVYDAAVETWRWPEVMEGLSALFKCEAALVISFDLRQKSSHILCAAGISPSFMTCYRQLAPPRPWLPCEATPATLETPGGGDQPDAASRIRFYRKWLKPQNLHHGMHVTISSNSDGGEVCVLLRRKDAGSFEADDIAAFDRLLPHLRRAWTIHDAFAALNAKYEGMLEIANRLPIGVVLVGSGGQVREVNERAQEIVSIDDGVRIDRRVLKAAFQSDSETLHALVALALDPEKWVRYMGDDVIALSRPSGLPAFNALVSPIMASQNVPGGPFAAVFLSEPFRPEQIDARRLQRLYELTPAEARLASLLAQGFRLEDLAAKLGISLNTARTHLKKIFMKTDTDRQVDLVRIILSGVPSIRVIDRNGEGHFSREGRVLEFLKGLRVSPPSRRHFSQER